MRASLHLVDGMPMLSLYDEDQKSRAEIMETSYGGGILLGGPDLKPALKLEVIENEAHLELSREINSVPVVRLFDRNGTDAGSGLQINDGKGNLTATLEAISTGKLRGTTMLSLTDKDLDKEGVEAMLGGVGLMVERNGAGHKPLHQASLNLFGKGGKVLWSVP